MLMKRSVYILFVFALLAGCNPDNPDNPGGGNKTTPEVYTISGVVSGSDGKVLKDVVVSDGLNCVLTDAEGRYYLNSDLDKTDYVFVSTPSAYAAPVKDGHACFWKFLKEVGKGPSGKYSVDFLLNKISSPERYAVLLFADPQPRKRTAGLDKVAYHSLDCCEDMYRDMKDYVATLGGIPVYGIGLGDIVHQDLSLLAQYKSGMSTTGVVTYNVIGNHDQQHILEQSDDEACKAYEAIMGPVNYSFNLGGIHYLMLDNMIAPGPNTGKYSDECITGLTDAIWDWVKNDLALVPADMPLMVCAHSPMMHMQNGKDRTGQHLADLRNLLSKHPKAYVWAGHTHSTYNYVDKANPVVETHTVSRVTGCLWTNEYLGSNGTPRGYVALNYDNGNVTWKFKPLYGQSGSYTGDGNGGKTPSYVWRDWDYVSGKAVLKSSGKPLDDSYQMQVFPPGTYGDKYLYVNVFLWDELWQAPRLTIDGVPTVMKRVTEKDFRYSFSDWDITSFYNVNTKVGSEFVPDKNNCDSMFRVYVDAPTGSGTVSVKDRFGNTFTSSITW